jgi:hypothetical protein
VSGYHLVAADGGQFRVGDASFRGSMAGTPLRRPVVGMAVASDGGLFSFGVPYLGSMGGKARCAPIVAMAG